LKGADDDIEKDSEANDRDQYAEQRSSLGFVIVKSQ